MSRAALSAMAPERGFRGARSPRARSACAGDGGGTRQSAPTVGKKGGNARIPEANGVAGAPGPRRGRGVGRGPDARPPRGARRVRGGGAEVPRAPNPTPNARRGAPRAGSEAGAAASSAPKRGRREVPPEGRRNRMPRARAHRAWARAPSSCETTAAPLGDARVRRPRGFAGCAFRALACVARCALPNRAEEEQDRATVAGPNERSEGATGGEPVVRRKELWSERTDRFRSRLKPEHPFEPRSDRNRATRETQNPTNYVGVRLPKPLLDITHICLTSQITPPEHTNARAPPSRSS